MLICLSTAVGYLLDLLLDVLLVHGLLLLELFQFADLLGAQVTSVRLADIDLVALKVVTLTSSERFSSLVALATLRAR